MWESDPNFLTTICESGDDQTIVMVHWCSKFGARGHGQPILLSTAKQDANSKGNMNPIIGGPGWIDETGEKRYVILRAACENTNCQRGYSVTMTGMQCDRCQLSFCSRCIIPDSNGGCDKYCRSCGKYYGFS